MPCFHNMMISFVYNCCFPIYLTKLWPAYSALYEFMYFGFVLTGALQSVRPVPASVIILQLKAAFDVIGSYDPSERAFRLIASLRVSRSVLFTSSPSSSVFWYCIRSKLLVIVYSWSAIRLPCRVVVVVTGWVFNGSLLHSPSFTS